MKKFLAVLSAVLVIFALAAVTACNKERETAEEKYTVTLSADSLTLDVYDKIRLTAVVKNGSGETVDKGVIWSSSQSSVVTADGGEIFAKSLGTAQITAQVDGGEAYATASVNVVMNGYVPRLELSVKDNLALAAGTDFDLSPKVLFKGVDATDGDTVFKYDVSDSSVASVTDGTVNALKAGTVQITVTASWRGLGGDAMVGSEDALGLRVTVSLTVKEIN